jgi:hypothetical protein
MYSDKPAYQPWNEEEFISDYQVRGMTPVQRWIYRTLLQAAFFHKTRPYLPNDDGVLWILAGCESMEQWKENKTAVLKCFTVAKHDSTLLAQKRVTADWNHLEETRARMAELGRRSAAARQMFSVRLTHDKQVSKVSKVSNREVKEDRTERIARKRAFPDDFTPNDSNRNWATKLGIDINAALEEFREFHQSKGNRFIDWHLAFNTWLRRAAQFSYGKPQQKVVNRDIFEVMKEQLDARLPE